ncbi:MAG: DUF6471 domain-containing protein [Pseudomonadales bacterium]
MNHIIETRYLMYKDPAMETLITRTIRAAMAQDGMSYADLVRLLEAKGIVQSESTLRSKVNNGTMAASLFLHLISCTSMQNIDLAGVLERYESIRAKNKEV